MTSLLRSRNAALRSLAAILPSIGLALSFYSNHRCEYVSLQISVDWAKNTLFNGVPTLFGLWSYRGIIRDGDDFYYACITYDETWDIDGKWLAARWFSIIADVLGTLTTISIYYGISSSKMSENLWRGLGFCCIAISAVQGLTLVFMNGNICSVLEQKAIVGRIVISSGCEIAAAAKTTIAAVIIWSLNAILLWSKSKSLTLSRI
mmetsp:Transcript_41221/g.48126  ORF Transcript_41221/g.48126 Transcript_41221/m.48126 type:complete len:205 (-) Transcript_41221:716-1330(-)|eukprot:CAMPEP_0194357854 /NCGR_PEP_ID=MMETSP0174-20130528/5281_1 /TAXON_ID=216777 /ORGANISM="Proboscia alata, Strain PI-D3" /LENGTH=204 /DNA_ID=CAMNT_0039128045 /DNA_START=68 /DNA_END=682 /DNA_ORIENTATION=+